VFRGYLSRVNKIFGRSCAAVCLLVALLFPVQRQIFISAALGYFKLGALLEGRGGRSHIFRLRIRSYSKNVCILVRVRNIFKFENPTPLQTPANMDSTEIQQCFYLRNVMYENHTDSCCWKCKVIPGPFFYKFLIPAPGPKEKRRILPMSTPTLRIRSHLWCRPFWHTKNWVIGFVAIGKPERHVRKPSHCGSKQQ